MNKFSSLSEEERRVLSHTLSQMVKCRGRECILPRYHNQLASQGNREEGNHNHNPHLGTGAGGHRGHRRKNGR